MESAATRTALIIHVIQGRCTRPFLPSCMYICCHRLVMVLNCMKVKSDDNDYTNIWFLVTFLVIQIQMCCFILISPMCTGLLNNTRENTQIYMYHFIIYSSFFMCLTFVCCWSINYLNKKKTAIKYIFQYVWSFDLFLWKVFFISKKNVWSKCWVFDNRWNQDFTITPLVRNILHSHLKSIRMKGVIGYRDRTLNLSLGCTINSCRGRNSFYFS
jgi:hypothetical protein